VDFLAILGCETHFKSELRRIRFSRFKLICARRHQIAVPRGYPRESRHFTAGGQSFVKTVADRHRHAVYQKSTSDELFSRINIDDFERP